MATPNYTIALVANPIGGTAGLAAGTCLVYDPASTSYLPATTANRGVKHSSGIAIGAAAVNGAVLMQSVGDIPQAISGLPILAPGTGSWVRVSATATLERVTPSGSDDVVGWAETDGTVHLCFGPFTPAIVNGSSGAVPTGNDGEVQTKNGAALLGATNVVAGSGYVGIGSGTMPAGGLFRTALGTSTGSIIKGRVGGVDTDIVQVASNGTIRFGDLNNWSVQLYGDPLTVWGKSSLNLYAGAGGAQLLLMTTNGVQIGQTQAADFGAGVAVIGIDNAVTDPTTNPTGGGILYASGGALKWRGSAGTVTNIANAEPHCPMCGSDVGVSLTENDVFGEELLECRLCELKTGKGTIRHIADFFDRKAA